LPSTAYSSAHFNSGNWGTVGCSAGNNVAWLKCETFDGCKVLAHGTPGFYVDKSYWGIQGFEVNATDGTAGACFSAAPAAINPTSHVHHIVFANNVANGCQKGGFSLYDNKDYSVDYVAIVGNIAYNAALATDNCYSGISVYQPMNTDWNAGTHIYVAGNLSYGNFDGTCNGGNPNGGDGLIFDTFDKTQGWYDLSGVHHNFSYPWPYNGQTLAENNIFVGNAAHGLEVQNNAGTGPNALIILRNNTVAENALANNEVTTLCADGDINVGYNIHAYFNVFASTETYACGNNFRYGFDTSLGNGTDWVYSNLLSGTLYFLNAASWGSGPFQFDSNNIYHTNVYSSPPAIPGAPNNCSLFGSVPACIANMGVIKNFSQTVAGAGQWGYQSGFKIEHKIERLAP